MSTTQGNIFWLASYPKSGNTWTRAFIANLLHEEPDPVDINELFTGAIASSRDWVESALDFDIDELSHDEVDQLRPAAYRYLSQQLDSPGYHKIHDAYTYLPSGEPLIPPAATRGALCIIRNPLDVAISFAHHSHCTIDRSIQNMAKPDFAFCKSVKHLSNQLRQHLLSWSAHVSSWIDAPDIAKLVVRYEDMRLRPIETFSRIATFLELPNDETSVATALEQCRIERLQAQEAEKPFKERAARAESFFRKGIVGDWQTGLTEEQINTIIQDHQLVMQRMGYLDSNAMPVTAYNQPRVMPEFMTDKI
jgi:aryl sulfotransferase